MSSKEFSVQLIGRSLDMLFYTAILAIVVALLLPSAREDFLIVIGPLALAIGAAFVDISLKR